MAPAVVWSLGYGPCSRSWTSDMPCSRQDYFVSGTRVDDFVSVRNLVSVRRRRSAGCCAATRSSSESASTGCFEQGRGASCFDPPCALRSSPVNNRDANVQRWVEESVHEIVRNIQEAPFLQYVFDSGQAGRQGRSQRQKLSQDVMNHPDPWSPIRESLSQADPDGVILVQKLEPGCRPSPSCLVQAAFQSANRAANEEERLLCPLLQAEGAETNMWGVLVQGRAGARGVHTNACYLLQTTRVSSSAGICTRYCLTRAQCFGPSPIDQLENAWLL